MKVTIIGLMGVAKLEKISLHSFILSSISHLLNRLYHMRSLIRFLIGWGIFSTVG